MKTYKKIYYHQSSHSFSHWIEPVGWSVSAQFSSVYALESTTSIKYRNALKKV